MISVTKPKNWMSTKIGSLNVGDCKSCIKPIHGANVLTSGTSKVVINFPQV